MHMKLRHLSITYGMLCQQAVNAVRREDPEETVINLLRKKQKSKELVQEIVAKMSAASPSK